MKNIWLKGLSLLLAVVLWMFVSAPRREAVRERIFTAPLSFVSMPDDLVITTDIPASVAVRVRGRTSDLRNLATQNFEVPVDLKWIQNPGEAEITLRPQAIINVPPEVEIVSIVPSKVRFSVEALRQRTVPVRPLLVGAPPAGYLIGEATASPEVVLVSGPASQVMKLSEVTTERINMTGRTATFVQSVVVVSDSPLVRIISPGSTQVTVPVLAEVGPTPPAAPASVPVPVEMTETSGDGKRTPP
jgi:YbbR domain-containing protein